MIVQTKRTIRSPLQKHKVRYQHHDKRSHCSADRFLDMDDGDEVHQINVDNKSAEQRIAQRHDIVRQWAGEQVEQYDEYQIEEGSNQRKTQEVTHHYTHQHNPHIAYSSLCWSDHALSACHTK